MDQISTAPHLRIKFDALPVKTGRVFKQQLLQSVVVFSKDGKPFEEVERTIRNQRAARMTGLSMPALEGLGLYATPVRIHY